MTLWAIPQVTGIEATTGVRIMGSFYLILKMRKNEEGKYDTQGKRHDIR